MLAKNEDLGFLTMSACGQYPQQELLIPSVAMACLTYSDGVGQKKDPKDPERAIMYGDKTYVGGIKEGREERRKK